MSRSFEWRPKRRDLGRPGPHDLFGGKEAAVNFGSDIAAPMEISDLTALIAMISAFAIWFAQTGFPKLGKRIAIIGLVLCLVCAFVIFIFAKTANHDALKQVYDFSKGSGNFSVEQTGGSIVQNYTQVEPHKATFQDIKDKLLSLVPRDKVVCVVAVGSDKDQVVGQEVATFLRNNGYTVTVFRAHTYLPQSDKVLTLRNYANINALIVDPSAY